MRLRLESLSNLCREALGKHYTPHRASGVTTKVISNGNRSNVEWVPRSKDTIHQLINLMIDRRKRDRKKNFFWLIRTCQHQSEKYNDDEGCLVEHCIEGVGLNAEAYFSVPESILCQKFHMYIVEAK